MALLKILIAEDSELFAHVLQDILSGEPDIEILAIVDNGEDAVRLCIELRPSLVLMDIQMPRLDGLSATEQIMATAPTPILVVTSDPYRNGVDLSFKALSAGALDLMAKPLLVPPDARMRADFLRKVRLLAQIPVIRHVRGKRKHLAPPVLTPVLAAASAQLSTHASPLVGVVASTGGPKALARLLDDLDEDFPGSLLIVQHITLGFTEHLARWLNTHTALCVREACSGDVPQAGQVLIAPGGKHMVLDEGGKVRLKRASSARGHCPSGDRLLESMARAAPERSLGVILSGMGDDGARGLRAMRDAGSVTLAQDRRSSVVWGMPQAAMAREAVVEVVELEKMGAQLNLLVMQLAGQQADQ